MVLEEEEASKVLDEMDRKKRRPSNSGQRHDNSDQRRNAGGSPTRVWVEIGGESRNPEATEGDGWTCRHAVTLLPSVPIEGSMMKARRIWNMKRPW